MAVTLNEGNHVPGALESYDAFAVFTTPNNLRGEAVGEVNDLTYGKLSARAHQRIPDERIFLTLARKEDLDDPGEVLPTVRIVLPDGDCVHALAMAEQAAGKYSRVVEDHAITGPQILGEHPEVRIHPMMALSLQNQHARRRALRERLLGNKLFRQLVIKLADVHTNG